MAKKEDYDWQVTVSGLALKEILEAVINAPHRIAEIKALSKISRPPGQKSIGDLTGDINPLDLLLDQYNAEVRRLKGETEQPPAPAPAPAAPPAEPVQENLPGVKEPYKRQPIVFYSKFAEWPVLFNEGEQTVMMPALSLGERDLSLDSGIFNAENLSEKYGWSDDDHYEDELNILGFEVMLTTNDGAEHIVWLPTPGKGFTHQRDDEVMPKFRYNKTVEHNGRIFTIETLIGFNTKTCEFRATEVGFNADCPTWKICEAFGIREPVMNAKLSAISFGIVRMVRQA